MRRAPGFVLLLAVVASAAWVALPMWLIFPFRPQTPGGVALSQFLREWAVPATLLLLIAGLVAAVSIWRRSRWIGKSLAFAGMALLGACAWLGQWNMYESMFHPLLQPQFVEAGQAGFVAEDDLVLGVHAQGDARAYPILAVAYHHIINDVVAGEPVVATYCTLCHTGMVYSSRLGERTLHFRLTGINNQNAMLRDVETGTWWQQSTGCAVAGPLKGQCLTPRASDEVTFAVWKREHPNTTVLAPDPATQDQYETRDWETEILELPTVMPHDPADSLQLRDIVIGVKSGASARAFALSAIKASRLRNDEVGETPILIVLHPDDRSIRCFDRRVEGRTIQFMPAIGTEDDTALFVDVEKNNRWDFTGNCISGPLAGVQLQQVAFLKSYWFDWKQRNPATSVFAPAS